MASSGIKNATDMPNQPASQQGPNTLPAAPGVANLPSKSKFSLPRFAGRRPFRRAKIRKKDVADLTAQLAMMTRSGVDVATALQSLLRQCRHSALAAVLEDVHSLVLDGRPFSQAISRHAAVFGPTYVATVAAGEASGRMSSVLGELSRLQRSELRLARTLRSLVAYPVLLASVSSLVITALVLFVLPQFADIFEQYDTPLPAITRALIAVATELRTHWWLWAPLALLCLAGCAAFRWSSFGRYQWDKFLLHCVLIRDVVRTLLVGRVCCLMGLMLESGVPLLECLRLARSAVGNALYAELFAHLEQEVINGRGLAPVLQDAEIVPASASEMIATAERTANLGEVTRLIGEHFEEEGEARMRDIITVLEPLITVGMGIIVAIIVLAVMLPMFDLTTFSQYGN